jgi:2-polyprenyl-6-methoxyphenol hydroxylase-like FAD-dependent oxidoreductase
MGVSAVEIVVIGGGVGGLTAALALALGGHRVQVLERASRFAQGGPGLRLAPNATAVLARLGLLDQVIDLGSRLRRAVLRDLGSGAELAELDLGAPLTARYGAPYVVIGRADLLSLLADACADADVELRPGREVTSVDQSHFASSIMGGPVVTCGDGRMYAADVVLAADGARSVARALFGAGEPSGDGWAAYRGTVPVDALAVGDADDEVVAWTGPDAHFTRYPVRVGEAYEQVAVFRSHLYPLVGAASPGGADQGPEALGWGGPEELDEAFSWATEPVRAAVRVLRRDHSWRMLDWEPLPSWTVDRVALLGDAVHPMPAYLAQGACQAIEDAVALADALADCPGPDAVAAALAGYQARRAPRVTRVARARQVWEAGPLPRRPADAYEASDWLYAPSAQLPRPSGLSSPARFRPRVQPGGQVAAALNPGPC